MPRYWVHSAPEDYADGGQRECARAERCSDPRIEIVDGRTRRFPALTYQAFCPQDRTAVSKALGDLPMLWVRVHQRLDKTFKTSNGPVVAVSKTAPVPLDLRADELLRLILAALVSWEERVRTVARLAELDTETSRRRRDGAILTQAYTTLAAHLDALLALPEEPMDRAGELVDLSGADAGLELLDLAWKCRAFLTDTRQPARHLPTPCGACGFCELREVLDDDGQHDGAKCRQCGTEYDAQAYADLTAEQAGPIRGAGVHRRRLVVAGADDRETRRA